MKVKVSDYIARFLTEHGITDCFMVTGGGAMHLDDALGHEPGMHCTFDHNEQAVTLAAEGYYRMSGRLCACCVTTGPGGTNAITGAMGAWLDSVPMFILSGQVKRASSIWSCPEIGLRQLGDQEFNIIDAVRCMTKYAVMITDEKEVAYHLEKALFLALDQRGGPVWLDVPLDIQGAIVETEEFIHFDPAAEGLLCTLPPFTKEDASAILQKIRDARAPLILAGTGIRLGNAEEEFLQLVDKLKIPVVTAWNANDSLTTDSPYYAGMPGTIGTRPGNFAVQNCDVILTLGCRMSVRVIGHNRYDFARNAYKIIVDIDPKELKKPSIKPDMPVNADVKDVIAAMLASDYEPEPKHEKWLAWCRDLIERFPVVPEAYHTKGSGKLNPYVFMDKLFDVLDDGERTVCGNASASVIAYQAGKFRKGQRIFSNGGSAPMGYGFPAALGAAVSDRTKRTICLDGEGSFMMNMQELATVAYNRLDMKIIIINNNGYLSIRQTQRNLFKPPFIGIDSTSGVGFPDFKKLADAFGVGYFRIDCEEAVEGTLTQMLSGKGPCICEVVVDANVNFAPKSATKVLPDGKIVSPSLDDMAPFLDREIYEAIHY